MSFWRYSLRLYRSEGVAEACLALQDRCGADVNLLLFCCWTAAQGRELSAREVRGALAAVRRWQREVVTPLRTARRALKRIIAALPAAAPGNARGPEAPGNAQGAAGAHALARLRKRIAAEELAAEYVEQQWLAGFAAGLATPTLKARPDTAVAINLERYVALIGGTVGVRERRCLEVLKGACASGSGRLPRA